MKKLVFSLCGVFIAASLYAADKPKYIFLFIGDGMSTPQRMTADEFARKDGRVELSLNRLPHQATTRTCSASSLVTDSAAAATAIACGEKTYNGAIGVDAKGNKIFSCAKAAHDAGKKVGIVTTVTINHATPAGFYGHRKNRGEGYGIGLDLLDSGFEYFAGGGLSGHNDSKYPGYKGDIYELATKYGYRFVREDRAAFDALRNSGEKVWYVARKNNLPFSIDRRADDRTPTLAEMTRKGIELLDNPNGFFMMIEGGMVDWAGHANDAATNLREVLSLDDAVREALSFQKNHPDTLVVVTGDHETGGMAMGFAGTGYAFYMDRLARQKCSAGVVPDYIARNRIGSFEQITKYVEENFGLMFSGDTKSNPMVLNKSERDELRTAFDHDLRLAKEGKKDNEAYDAKKLTRFPTALKSIMSHKCGIGWTSGAHTALPVLTTAGGPGAERFSGYLDNTDISKILKDLVK